MGQQLKFWLQTTFQNGIEVALQLSKKPAAQQTPFEHKYKAIQRLKKLLNHDHNYKFIVYCILGQIYSDVQQTNDSIKSYTKCLLELSNLSLKQIPQFYQYFIVCYNMLGLSFINRDQDQSGIGCLCKAYNVYQSCKQYPGVSTYHNRSHKSKGRQFRFFYEGGNDFQQIQQNHTLTLFYLAQAYTKIGLKDKAAQYCGLTLKRQYAYQKFEVKEFCHNLIGLSEYYLGKGYFAQAEYILLLALKVLPEGGKKKMRALVQIQIGKLLSAMLQHTCALMRNTQSQLQPQASYQHVNKKFLLFHEFDQKFPQLKLTLDMQACKSLFRKANTQFKKASQVFVLDGFVTQNVEILFQQSRLYKSLSMIQKSRQRVFSMLQKRRQILEPLLKQLNPKAYPATWQKILVEVSQIYNDLFNIKQLLVIDTKVPATQQKLQQMAKIGLSSISYYKKIITALQQDKDAQRNDQYFRSIINSKFNISKTESKLLSLDKNVRVNYLKDSFNHYKELASYIEHIQKNENRKGAFNQELKLTNDMIAMMPNKIDKINYGMVSPLE